MLIISVIDNGEGIKRKNQSKMFKLFSTIKDERRGINTKGIGLGLFISKQIAEQFNGQINFISKYGKGSTFFYSFEVYDFDVEDHLKHNLIQTENNSRSLFKMSSKI